MFSTLIRGAALACAISASIALAQETAPDALLKEATAEVVSLAKQSRGHLNAARTHQVNETIERKILPLFDFERMTQSAVGRSWASATPEQRSALTREFTTLLVRTYSTALRNYRDEKIEFKPLELPQGATQATVKSVIKQGTTVRTSIEYDMEKTRAGWKIHDIRMDGVNVIANYRGTFASKIRAGGVDALVRALAEKNGNYLALAGPLT